MKNLIPALSLTRRTRSTGGGSHRGLVYAGLGAVLCLAIPVTTAYAEEPEEPDFAGTVTCVETRENRDDYSIVSSSHEYYVELRGGVIENRWGEEEGNDVQYGDFLLFKRPGQSPDEFDGSVKSFTTAFWTMPADISCNVLDEDLLTYPVQDGELDKSMYYSNFDFCLPDEQRYSETGKWKYRLQKDQWVVTGTSFVVMEYPLPDGWTVMSAECTWKLIGPFIEPEP